MRDPKTALSHLRKASAAIKAGDGSTARHHIGHALANSKQGFGPLKGKPQPADVDPPSVSAPPNQAAPMTMRDRLKSLKK